MSVIYLFILQAQAATLCRPNQAFTNIQNAVSAAQSGDTIEVEAGTYAEAVRFGSKELTIIGSLALQVRLFSLLQITRFFNEWPITHRLNSFTLQPFLPVECSLSASPILQDLIIEGANTTGQGGEYLPGGAPVLSNIIVKTFCQLW